MDNNTARLFIAEPEECYANIVVVDPGHGDTDPGTTKSIYNEKNINLRTAFFSLRLPYFKWSKGLPYAYTDDTLVDLYDREELAAMTEADVFLSLHVNSANSSSTKGTGVYYCKSNNSENPNGLTSKKTCPKTCKICKQCFIYKNNGAIAGDFVVIMSVKYRLFWLKSDICQITMTDVL